MVEQLFVVVDAAGAVIVLCFESGFGADTSVRSEA